jgi:D-glycero-alpha-D-manno-heptose-7-phosphate kinase
MILTRTPFRVTLGGGGTDLPSFYERHGGFVLAMGINKYMYVAINTPGIDRKIRLHYTQSEVVDHVSQVRHELAREALRLHGFEDRLEIASMADLPAGTGVGSSSAYLVGLLRALHEYRREFVSLQALAEEACHIELDVLAKGIGKQDQYMAAFGGLTVLDIARDGRVQVRNVALSAGAIASFLAQTHIYYTGLVRDAVGVLADQNGAMRSASSNGSNGQSGNRVEDSLCRIKEIGGEVLDALQSEDFDRWGRLLHEHWVAKRQMSAKISVSWIDALYDEVRTRFGVIGGKIMGAGGGGFLMLYCPPRKSKQLEEAMAARGLPRMYYRLEYEGVKVVANLTNSELFQLRDDRDVEQRIVLDKESVGRTIRPRLDLPAADTRNELPA